MEERKIWKPEDYGFTLVREGVWRRGDFELSCVRGMWKCLRERRMSGYVSVSKLVFYLCIPLVEIYFADYLFFYLDKKGDYDGGEEVVE